MTFQDTLEKYGYKPDKPIAGDTGGAWKRLYFNGEKRSSGRYTYIQDGERELAIYGSDKDPLGFRVWRSWDGQTSDDETHRQNMEWARKKQAEIERKQKKRNKRNSTWLTVAYENLTDAPVNHPYLSDKQIEPEQIRYREKTKALIVPVISAENSQVTGLQYIYGNGSKIFMKGSKVLGNFCPLKRPDESAERIVICEGYATGRSIRQVTGWPVFVAFNAGNLKPVAEAIRARYPEAGIIIAADNDQFTPKSKGGNIGVKKAKAAAAAVSGFVQTPTFTDEDTKTEKYTDWNDYCCLYGAEMLYNEFAVVKAEPMREQSVTTSTPSLAADSHAPSAHIVIDKSNYREHLRWKDNAANYILDNKYSIHNADLFLSFSPEWEGTFVYDEFQQTERVVKPLPWDDGSKFHWRDITETDKTQLRGRLQLRGINISSNGEMTNILRSVALKKTVHPVRKYFDRLQWDGKPRLDNWLIEYCDATEQPREYVQAVGSCFIKASVKRIYEAGTPFHHMMVLEGKQAAGKSSLLKALCTFSGVSYFTDGICFDDIGKPHIAQFLKGKLIIEFAELSGLSQKDRNKVKSWITMDTDEIQPKFANEILKLPRQFVLAGSTNDEGWLNDPTGGRRFWPVKVGKVKMDAFNMAKEQLWAEAVHRVKSGELHYIPDDSPVYAQAMNEQAERYDSDPWEDSIARYVVGRTELEIEELFKEALFIPTERWTRATRSRVADILKQIGYKNKSVWDARLGKAVRKWAR